MNLKDIQELIDFISRSEFSHFEMENEGFKLKLIRRGKATMEPGNTKLNSSCLGAPPFRGDPKRPLKDRFDFYNALPQYELYDLAADPYEVYNIADANGDRVAELDDLLRAHIARDPKRWIENA